MSFFKSLAITFLTLSLFYQTVSGEEFSHACSTSDNFTTNEPYETNLKELLDYLLYEAPPTGFAVGSKGEGVNQIHGLALCRGDLSSTDYSTCVAHASNEVRKLCSYNKGAILWYENGTVRYEKEEFFGQIDYKHLIYTLSNENASDPKLFGERTQKFLSNITEEAVLDPKRFEAGTSELDGFSTIYGWHSVLETCLPWNVRNV